MSSANLTGIFLSLSAALVWGGGDFSGGFATRRSSQFQVLTISALSGIVGLALVALLRGERLPSLWGAVWAGLAGLAGAWGLASLYQALSIGPSASVAPTSGVIGAALPAIFSSLTTGLPGTAHLSGFGLAFAGIWLVSQAAGEKNAAQAQDRSAFWLACMAGVGFGGFFIFVAQTEADRVFSSLLVTRIITLLVALVLLKINRQALVSPLANPAAALAGLLDASGNVLFVLAKEFTRLDTVAVLSSLYPASTVLLSYFLFKEAISPKQWLGAGLCLAAIVLITI